VERTLNVVFVFGTFFFINKNEFNIENFFD
jgi:hypothetical protein